MDGTKVGTKVEVWQGQMKRVFDSLSRTPQTRLQVSAATGTPIQNTCRYVAKFRALGKLIVLRSDTCPISKMKAEVITTNADLIKGKQLQMFGEPPAYERNAIALLTNQERQLQT